MTTIIKDRSEDTKLLVELGKSIAVDEILTYERISNDLRLDICKDRSAWFSAMRILQRDFGIKFDCIRKVGYKRVCGNDIVGKVVPTKMKSIRHKTNNALKDVRTALNDELNNESLIKAHMQASMLGVLREISKPRQQKRIEDGVRAVGKEIACGNVLELMKDKRKTDLKK